MAKRAELPSGGPYGSFSSSQSLPSPVFGSVESDSSFHSAGSGQSSVYGSPRSNRSDLLGTTSFKSFSTSQSSVDQDEAPKHERDPLLREHGGGDGRADMGSENMRRNHSSFIDVSHEAVVVKASKWVSCRYVYG